MNENRLTPDPLDNLISRSVDRLDRSPGLPSNFAYRMAMMATEKRSARAAASRRRERIMSWAVPAAMAAVAIAALVWAVPTLPGMLNESISESARDSVSGSSLSMWGLIAGAVVALMALEGFLRRRLAKKFSR